MFSYLVLPFGRRFFSTSLSKTRAARGGKKTAGGKKEGINRWSEVSE